MRKMRKNYQKRLNKLVKEVNKNVMWDNLWLGRFEMRQKDAWFEKFDDNSGGILYAVMRVYDKKTGYYKDYRIEYAPYFNSNRWHLWEMMNTFITADADVWMERPSPREREFAKDYRKERIPDNVMSKKYNFYLGVKYADKL